MKPPHTLVLICIQFPNAGYSDSPKVHSIYAGAVGESHGKSSGVHSQREAEERSHHAKADKRARESSGQSQEGDQQDRVLY